MKLFALAFISLISSNIVVAGTNTSSKAIYNALTVRAVNVNPGILGSSRLEKSVGNLTCTMSTVIYPNAKPSYGCSLGQNNNPKAVYNALNVKEVNMNPGIAGSYRLQKAVGGLVCEKSAIVVLNARPEYMCSLN